MVLVEPKERVADQEVDDLAPAEVEDEGAPVLVLAEARVGMFIQVGAVEITEAVLIAREVSGDPVEDDADAALVERIDQEHEVLRRPEAAGRREVTDGLIPPGGVERMFVDGQ